MSLIDWSSPEEMLGLLIEYVVDELIATHDDPDRTRFLSELARALAVTAGRDFKSVEEVALALREIHAFQPREFATDAVMNHLEACIEEMDRIRN